MPARVNVTLCKAAKDCIDACPTEAITIVEDLAKVNAEECTECQACVDACANQAIEMIEA
jgi:ferredoxin